MIELPPSSLEWTDSERLAWEPPADLSVSEWADTHRILHPLTSAEPGQWRTSRTPYLEGIMDAFSNGAYDRVELLYNRFVNAAVQDVQCEQMLPIEQGASEGEGGAKEVDYIFEPNREEIVANIVPNTLKIQLYKALLDSHASEHGARMTAMHKATENAGELLRDLKLSYNKARQAAITAEILEIVGGAEALEG